MSDLFERHVNKRLKKASQQRDERIQGPRPFHAGPESRYHRSWRTFRDFTDPPRPGTVEHMIQGFEQMTTPEIIDRVQTMRTIAQYGILGPEPTPDDRNYELMQEKIAAGEDYLRQLGVEVPGAQTVVHDGEPVGSGLMTDFYDANVDFFRATAPFMLGAYAVQTGDPTAVAAASRTDNIADFLERGDRDEKEERRFKNLDTEGLAQLAQDPSRADAITSDSVMDYMLNRKKPEETPQEQPQEQPQEIVEEPKSDWVEYTDPASGAPYYYSASRGESTWVKPETMGGRKKKKDDFLGVKGNYKKHYTWVEDPSGRRRAGKEMFDTPLAAERLARSSKAGDKDVAIARTATGAVASTATYGLQPTANAIMQRTL